MTDLEPVEHPVLVKKRRKAGTSPTQRSLAYVRNIGGIAAVVEHWNPHVKIRQDLFGCLDVVGLLPNAARTIGIQACVTGDQQKRIAKILAEPRARAWVACGNALECHGWAKRGERGKRKLWTLSKHVFILGPEGLVATKVE